MQNFMPIGKKFLALAFLIKNSTKNFLPGISGLLNTLHFLANQPLQMLIVKMQELKIYCKNIKQPM